MNDRFADLRDARQQFEGPHGRSPYADHEEFDIETGHLTPKGDSSFKEGFDDQSLEHFYDLISQVKLNTHKLKQHAKKVKQFGEQFMESENLDQDLKKQREKALQDEKQEALTITQKTGGLLQQLQKIKEETKQKFDMNDPQGIESGYRMIMTGDLCAHQNWKSAMEAYINIEKKISNEMRDRFRRHYQIAKGEDPTAEQLDEMEDEAPDVFAQTMMGKADLKLAQDVNKAAHTKEAQVKNILAGQQEILELWSQLGVIVESQGEMLNNIFSNVEKAKEYVKEANQELREVPNYTRRTQRCYCFIIIGLVIILVVVAIPVWVSQTSNSDSSSRRSALLSLLY